MGVLTVTVVKATGLADEDLIGKTDPYVKLSLEQDNFVSYASRLRTHKVLYTTQLCAVK